MEGRYMVEVIGISAQVLWEDVYHFFLNCGNIKHLEINRMSADISIAYVEFDEAYSVKIALFLSGSEIANHPVTITSCGTHDIDPSPYLYDLDEEAYVTTNNSTFTRSDNFVSTPQEAVTVVQGVVQTMIAKGYVLSKEALYKARAFDQSHQVSSTTAAKVAELSKRIGLTDKLNSGIETVKYVDQKYNVYETTKAVASYTGKTAARAAGAVVGSSYFAKGALWVSDVLDHAAKAAAELGNRGAQK